MADVNFNRINDEELGKFLDSFDPISLKYGLDSSSKLYIDALEFEKSSQPVDYSPIDNASFVQSMCMVYGCDELEANAYLGRCRSIRDKLLNKYVHINGLSQLFNEHFVEFEWDMHSKMDFSEHKISYYRDHFFHQLRDCYMLYILLNDTAIYNRTSKVLCDESTSKVSRYFTEVLEKIVFSVRDRHRQNDLLEHIALENFWSKPDFESGKSLKEVICEFVDSSIKCTETAVKVKKAIQLFVTKHLCVRPASILDDTTYLIPQIEGIVLECCVSSEFPQKDIIEKDTKKIAKSIAREVANKIVSALKTINTKPFAREHFAKYLIFSSAFVASLFHDIGYPITHYMVVQKRLLNLSPSIYMLINGDKSSYEKIAAKLSQSLVFQLIKKEDIVQRCEKGDHGVFSAIIFLLHFYESGLIYSLPIEQKAVIELAALAIFNHTNRYEAILGEDKHSECHYYKPVFELNPISYLLRVCDDAQEWSRTYFEINDAPSMLYCTRCHTPLIRVRKAEKVNYKCRCGNMAQLQCTLEKSAFTDFKRRIIFNVVPCTELQIRHMDEGKCIRFDYDLFQLLRICPLSTTYAALRTRELNFLRDFLHGQNLGLPLTIDFIMSCNPVFIKSFIVSRYIEIKSCSVKYSYEILHDFIDSCIGDLSDSKLIDKWKCQVDFYWNIYRAAIDIFTSTPDDEDEIISKNAETLTQPIDDLANHSLIKKLVYDAIKRHIDVIKNLANTSSNKYMKSKKSLLFDVNFYCDPENPINWQDANVFCPDYYSDLFLFEKMNQYIMTNKTGAIR